MRWPLLLLLACTNERSLAPLVPPPETQSFILVVDDGALRLSAHPRERLSEPGGLAVDVSPNARLWVLTYAVPLGVLGLAPGPLELQASPTCPLQVVRPLPAPDQVFATVLEAFVGADWTPQPQLPEALAALRLPPLDAIDCLSHQYCVRAGAERCVSDCPATLPPAPAAAPAPPLPPQACAGDCDWSPTPCPGGFWRPGGCVTFDPCPGATFPEAGPGVFWVATSGDGDGSRERPFGGLAQAAPLVPAGSTLILSRGEHRAAPLSQSLVLQGACTADTRIMGRLEIRSASVALSRVTLVGGLTAETATVSLRQVQLRETDTLLRARHSRLLLHQVWLQGGITGLHAHRGVTTLSATFFEAHVDHGLWCEGAQVRATGVHFADLVATQGALELDACRFELRHVAWSGQPGPAVRAFDADVTIRDGRIEPGGRLPPIQMLGGRHHLERLSLVEPGGDTAIVVNNSELVLRDIGIVNSLDGQSAVVALLSTTRLERLWVEGEWTRAIDLVDGEVTASDVRVAQRPSTTNYNLSLRNLTGRWDRTHLSGGGRGIDLRGSSALRFQDLQVTDTAERAFDLATDIAVEWATVVERARFAAVAQGVFMEEGSLVLRDLTIDRAQTGLALRPRTGAEIYAVELDRAVVRSATLGLELLPNPLGAYQPTLRNLSIIEATTGAIVAPCISDEGALLESVRFERSGPVRRP